MLVKILAPIFRMYFVAFDPRGGLIFFFFSVSLAFSLFLPLEINKRKTAGYHGLEVFLEVLCNKNPV